MPAAQAIKLVIGFRDIKAFDDCICCISHNLSGNVVLVKTIFHYQSIIRKNITQLEKYQAGTLKEKQDLLKLKL